jgi:hypothetical protein
MQKLKLIVDEHFTQIINKLDIHVEQLLCDEKLRENDSKEINRIRLLQIEQIEKIKNYNLNNIEHHQKLLMLIWEDLLNDSSTIDKLDRVKKFIILKDCVLMKNVCIKSGICLWSFGWYLSQEQLSYLRYDFI